VARRHRRHPTPSDGRRWCCRHRPPPWRPAADPGGPL
jgi:hypothetical protein